MQVSEIENSLEEISANFRAMKANSHLIASGADMIFEALQAGGKTMFCGNGGSAADSQHLAAELMGRFLVDRKPLASVALTVDTSVLTAVGNDYGYEHVFSRQLRGLGRRGDVLVGLSTSGNSKNVIEAFAVAREMGVKTIGLTGMGGGAMADKCDLWIPATASRTDHIQELHIAIGHMLCGIVEARFVDAGS